MAAAAPREKDGATCAGVLGARIEIGAPGRVVLDESSGSITFCPAAVSGSNQPYGKCAGIGGLPTANLVGNGFVGIGGLAAFVGNLATGYVVECALIWNTNTGQPVGSCVPLVELFQAPHCMAGPLRLASPRIGKVAPNSGTDW
jgi:hypothetical protein